MWTLSKGLSDAIHIFFRGPLFSRRFSHNRFSVVYSLLSQHRMLWNVQHATSMFSPEITLDSLTALSLSKPPNTRSLLLSVAMAIELAWVCEITMAGTRMSGEQIKTISTVVCNGANWTYAKEKNLFWYTFFYLETWHLDTLYLKALCQLEMWHCKMDG